MTGKLISAAITITLLAGCGPKTQPVAQEPEGTQEAEETQESEAAGEPEPEAAAAEEPDGETEEVAAAEPPTIQEAEDVVGSASSTEVAPVKSKEFDVQTEVNFSPSLPQEKKEKALMQIGIATAGVTDCYIAQLEKNKQLGGEIEVTVKINPTGIPKPVKAVKNTTENEKLKVCVIQSFKKRKFPKKLSGTTPIKATVTLTFVPQK